MRVSPIFLIVACAWAPMARAQATLPAPVSDAALAAHLARDAELADQNRRSEALNVEINRRNREVQARNDASRAAYEKAEAEYRAALAKHDADAAEVQAAYQKSVDAWKADVAACKAGEVKRCAPAPAAAGSAAP